MGRVEQRPVVREGQVVVGEVAPLFVRADHRIASAYQMAQFSQTIRKFLINPQAMEEPKAEPGPGESTAIAA